MSLEPSPPSTESTPHEPPGENERKTLKPGKGYGIIALLCGAEGFLAILTVLLTYLLISAGVIMPHLYTEIWNLWAMFMIGLFFINPFCVIAGIVFGIFARNTEGRFYGYTGLGLSLFCGLTVSPYAVFCVYIMFFAPRCC